MILWILFFVGSFSLINIKIYKVIVFKWVVYIIVVLVFLKYFFFENILFKMSYMGFIVFRLIKEIEYLGKMVV